MPMEISRRMRSSSRHRQPDNCSHSPPPRARHWLRERPWPSWTPHSSHSSALRQSLSGVQTLVAQIAEARAQQASVMREVASSTAHIEQVRDRIAKSRVVNPTGGTVLATYVKAGEVVQPAQPLYRIAKLDTLTLRAYVTEQQLGSLKLGQRIQVHADRGDGTLATFPGVVAWVSSKAEFTPTPVQTRDERASLVYAVKISVPNTGAVLKIGMPGDLRLAPVTKGT